MRHVLFTCISNLSNLGLCCLIFVFGLSSLTKCYSFCLVSSTWTHATQNDRLRVHGTAPEPANMIHHPTPHLHIHRKEGAGLPPPLFRLHMGTFHWMGVGGCSCYLRPFGDDLLVLWRVVNLMWQWQVLPWKINNMEPKKIHPWKRQLIFQFSIFRFHINLPGWTFVSFVGFRLHRNQGQTVSSTSTAETGTSHWASERRSLFKWYCYLQDAVLIDLWYCF